MKQLTPPGVWQGLFFSQKLGRRPNRPHELLAFQRYPFSVNNFVSRGLLGMRKNPKHISSGVTQWEVKKHKTHFIRCHPEASATATNTLLGNLRISFFPALSWSPLLRPSLRTPATFFPASLLSEEANMLLLIFLVMFFFLLFQVFLKMYSERCLSLLWFSVCAVRLLVPFLLVQNYVQVIIFLLSKEVKRLRGTLTRISDPDRNDDFSIPVQFFELLETS